MKSFEYATPNTLEEACTLLADSWGDTEVLAGGTDLITCIKQGLTSPKRVVSLKNISALKEIQVAQNEVHIGSMVTLAQLQEHGAPNAILQAIKGIGARQMIAQGTVGGELLQRPRCWYFRNGYGLLNKNLVENGDNRYHAIFANDGAAAYVHPSSLAPALIALGATAHISSADGTTRKIGVNELFQSPTDENSREHVLNSNEVLTGISYSLNDVPSNATYEVRHRHGLDWPYVTASVALGSIPVVVVGHVAPVPWIASDASKILRDAGSDIDEMPAAKAAEAAAAGATPLSGNAYKIAMLKTAVKRAILATQEGK